jgi:predicted DNA repair protein MutK
MFLVGGGILEHGLPPLHHAVETLVGGLQALPGLGGVAAALAPLLADLLIGVVAGALVLAVVSLAKRLFKRAPVAAG